MINELTITRLNEHTGLPWAQIALSNGYKIRKIDGLGPVKTNIHTLAIATDAGSEFMGARDGMRNIMMLIEFNPNYSIGETITSLRRSLYNILMPGERVELEFDIDTTKISPPDVDEMQLTGQLNPLKITGYVEAHEPDIYAANPTVAISIICPNPYFHGGWGLATYTLGPTKDVAIPYESNVSVGFVFEFNVTANSSSGWFLHGTGRNGYFGVVEPMKAGDKYIVSTVSGDRYVKRVRDSATSNVLGLMTGSLNSMKLYPGLNHMTFTNPGNTSDRKIRYEYLFGGL